MGKNVLDRFESVAKKEWKEELVVARLKKGQPVPDDALVLMMSELYQRKIVGFAEVSRHKNFVKE